MRKPLPYLLLRPEPADRALELLLLPPPRKSFWPPQRRAATAQELLAATTPERKGAHLGPHGRRGGGGGLEGAEAEPEHGPEGHERRSGRACCATPEMKAVKETTVGLGSEASAAAAAPGRSSLE